MPGLDIPLEVDGNVSFGNIPKMVAAGADILVAGTSSLFNQAASTSKNMRNTREAIAAGLRIREPKSAAGNQFAGSHREPMSTATMNALVLHAVNDASCELIPLPEPKASEVLVRVGFCGVCNSIFPGSSAKGAYSFPLVCGHEFAGVVRASARRVTKFGPGDRVAVFPLLWCGNCSFCEQGLYVQCLNYNYLGSRTNGAFADYVTAPGKNLLHLSDEISLEEAAMIEPAGGGTPCAEARRRMFRRRISRSIRRWANRFDGGAMGPCDGRSEGSLLVDIVSEKLELAKKLGVQYVIDLRQRDPVVAIEHITGGLGAHICIDAAGVPEATVQTMRAARHGGRIVLLGNPTGDLTVPAELVSRLMRREVQIFGTWNSDYGALERTMTGIRVLTAIATKVIDVKVACHTPRSAG